MNAKKAATDKIRLALLLTPKMKPVPPEISALEDWGFTTIITDDMVEVVSGEYVYLEGTREAFVRWLSPYDGVWFGAGDSPMLQQFEVRHVPRVAADFAPEAN